MVEVDRADPVGWLRLEARHLWATEHVLGTNKHLIELQAYAANQMPGFSITTNA